MRANHKWGIPGLLVLASILPTLALWNRATYLSGDSYQYLRGGLSFATGQGLKDMSGNPFTFHPPLYPLLIGLLHRLAPDLDLETAARLVSLAGASIAVPAFYWLVQSRYSPSIAFSAALLFALLPLRVWSGQWVLSEGLYVGFLMLGLLVFFRFGLVSKLGALIGGVVFGLAYLTRPEAILYVAAIAFVTLISALKGQRRRALMMIFLMAGVFAVALPYHAWVYKTTGAPTSKRVALNLAQSESFYRGQGPQFVYLNEVNQAGTSIQQSAADTSLRAVWTRYKYFAGTEIKGLVYDAGPHWIVWGLLLIGIILLLINGPIRLVRRPELGDMWQFVLPLMLLVLPFLHIEDRYLLQVIPVVLLWVVMVIAGIHSQAAIRLPVRMRSFAHAVPFALAIVFALSYGYRLVTQLPKTDESLLARNTAAWLQSQQITAAPILSQNPDLAFFANTIHIWMPAGESESVVMYAQTSGAHFIYVSSADVPTPLNNLLLGDTSVVPESLHLLHEEVDGSVRARLFSIGADK